MSDDLEEMKEKNWLEGFKIRLDSCKQGAVVSTVLIAAIGVNVRASQSQPQIQWWTVLAFVVLALAIGCSALAHLFFGHALSYRLEQAVRSKRWASFANWAGNLELCFLIVGMGFTIWSLLH
jgi:hypothetical protein